MKKFGEKEAWAYPGTSQFFGGIPYYLRNVKSYVFQIGQYIQRIHPNKIPLKILEKRERGRIQGLLNFFGYPAIISGTATAAIFKFCSIGTKVH